MSYLSWWQTNHTATLLQKCRLWRMSEKIHHLTGIHIHAISVFLSFLHWIKSGVFLCLCLQPFLKWTDANLICLYMCQQWESHPPQAVKQAHEASSSCAFLSLYPGIEMVILFYSMITMFMVFTRFSKVFRQACFVGRAPVSQPAICFS